MTPAVPSSPTSPATGHLVDRHPTVSPERLIAQLIPPPTFVDVSFDSYRPDPAEPTQTAALASCRSFCEEAIRRRAGRKKLFGRHEALPGVGLYLDGGFGVGKTHLLASAYRSLPDTDPKAFATFGELTQLAGVFGFAECTELLADYTMVCIDEFELDDPGDTVLMSTLLGELVEAGVSLAASIDEIAQGLASKQPIAIQSDAEEALANELEQMPDEIDEGQRLVQTQLALICRQLGPLRTLAAHLIKDTSEA